jgi:hypothetical protein
MEDRGCFFALVRLALVLALTLGLACEARLDEAYGIELGARAAPRASDGLERAARVRVDGAPARVAERQALLERLVLNSERIALAKVARVVEIEQRGQQISRSTWPASEIPVALLELERVLVGPKDEQRLIVVAAQRAGHELELLVKKGGRALVFLETDDTFRGLDERTRAELTKLAGPIPLRVFAAGGLWMIDAAGAAALPDAQNVLPADLGAHVNDGKVPSAELVEWAQARVAAAYPWVSAGNWRPYVRVEASCEVHSFHVHTGTRAVKAITPSQWTELWEVVHAARLREMPESIGQHRNPPGGSCTIEVHTTTGMWKSKFVDWNPTTDYERDCMERARPVWDALMKLHEQP